VSIVTDAADGADGVIASVYGHYPDCPRFQPPLEAEDNFNPECAEEGLCPAQASERAGELLGQPDRLVPTCNSSDALPVHSALSARISRRFFR
jgi:hypothetical protein